MPSTSADDVYLANIGQETKEKCIRNQKHIDRKVEAKNIDTYLLESYV